MKDLPPWVVIVVALLGGGTLGGSGMNILGSQTLQNEVESLKGQIYNMQQTDREILIKLGACK